MLPQSDVMKYGGKAAILSYVKDKLPSMPIKPFVVKAHDATIDSVVSDFEAMRKPVIVRSSSPYEYGDFEGIFESVKEVYDTRGLAHAIKRVEESAVSERAKVYAKQKKLKIDKNISVIIQEQSDSHFLGAMMRHPNNPDLILIGYHDNEGRYRNDYSRAVFDDKKNVISENNLVFSNDGISEDEAKFLVDNYKQIESLTEVADGYSLFVEFGTNPFSLYQVRPFKKIETASFELPDVKDVLLHSDLSFGITPKKGIVLPVIRGIGYEEASYIADSLGRFEDPDFEFTPIEMGFKMQLSNVGMVSAHGAISQKEFIEGVNLRVKYHNLEMDKEMRKKYCFMTSSTKNDDFDTDLSVPKMKALIVGHANNFLVHNMMRLIKKADVSVLTTSLLRNKLYQNAKSIEDKVRIISNGREAIVLRE